MILPLTEMAPPLSTDPKCSRRPFGSLAKSATPAVERRADGPRSTVVSPSVGAGSLEANLFAPEIRMLPPEAFRLPRMETVMPESESVPALGLGTPPGKVMRGLRMIELPASCTSSPLTSSFVPTGSESSLRPVARRERLGANPSIAVGW